MSKTILASALAAGAVMSFAFSPSAQAMGKKPPAPPAIPLPLTPPQPAPVATPAPTPVPAPTLTPRPTSETTLQGATFTRVDTYAKNHRGLARRRRPRVGL